MRTAIFMGIILVMLSFMGSATLADSGCTEGQMMVNGGCGAVSLSALNLGWNKIEPGGETTCAHGTPYAYWVRPGSRNDLLVYFEGGGGCWNADTCRDTGVEFNGFYDSRISGNDNPALRDGLLDFENPQNPFRDYSALYVPVCTGDVHWGDNVHTYPDAAGDVTIHFKGYVNAAAALDWAYTQVSKPDSVFVTGCSAGSAASIYHAPYIIEQYPDTPVVQFGDSLSLLFTRPVDLQSDWHAHDHFPQWIPELAAMKPEEWTMARFYSAIARYYPTLTFSQFNSIRDRVQVFYTFPDGSGGATEWTGLLEAHLAEIQNQSPNYRSFTPGGDLHCITPRNAFYNYAIDGISLRDWVANLANGTEVESLHCTDCEQAELVSEG